MSALKRSRRYRHVSYTLNLNDECLATASLEADRTVPRTRPLPVPLWNRKPVVVVNVDNVRFWFYYLYVRTGFDVRTFIVTLLVQLPAVVFVICSHEFLCGSQCRLFQKLYSWFPITNFLRVHGHDRDQKRNTQEQTRLKIWVFLASSDPNEGSVNRKQIVLNRTVVNHSQTLRKPFSTGCFWFLGSRMLCIFRRFFILGEPQATRSLNSQTFNPNNKHYHITSSSIFPFLPNPFTIL